MKLSAAMAFRQLRQTLPKQASRHMMPVIREGQNDIVAGDCRM